MGLARRWLAECLERWTCNSEVPSLSPTLTATGFGSPDFVSSTTFVNTEPAGLPEDLRQVGIRLTLSSLIQIIYLRHSLGPTIIKAINTITNLTKNE